MVAVTAAPGESSAFVLSAVASVASARLRVLRRRVLRLHGPVVVVPVVLAVILSFVIARRSSSPSPSSGRAAGLGGRAFIRARRTGGRCVRACMLALACAGQGARQQSAPAERAHRTVCGARVQGACTQGQATVGTPGIPCSGSRDQQLESGTSAVYTCIIHSVIHPLNCIIRVYNVEYTRAVYWRLYIIPELLWQMSFLVSLRKVANVTPKVAKFLCAQRQMSQRGTPFQLAHPFKLHARLSSPPFQLGRRMS